MIYFFKEEQAKEIWDDMTLLLSNPTYYQSFNWSKINEGISPAEYVYSKNACGNINIMGFVKIVDNERVSIPFGPVFDSNVSYEEVLDFIGEIRKYYNKKVSFSLPYGFINDDIITKFNLEKGWYFATPLVDTNKSIDDIVKGCDENRRRIIRKVLRTFPPESIQSGSVYAEEFMSLYTRRLIETSAEQDLSMENIEKMLKYDNTALTVCLDNNKIIAGSLTYEFGDTLITRYNCFDSNYFKFSPVARIDYELLKYASLNPSLKFFDMSGIVEGDNISDKEKNLNRYKNSYRPSKILRYQWYKKD